MSDRDGLTARAVLAERAARLAGRELLARRGRPGALRAKTSATDPVSEADEASERVLVDRIAAARPDDGVVAEEGASRPATSGWRWVVDPLDGTVNYLYGLPIWAVSVACERLDDDGVWQPAVGVVHDPAHGETWTALTGRGAWLGSRRLRLADPPPPERALVATGFAYDAERRAAQGRVAASLLPRVRDVRRAGACAVDLCWVAGGRVDAFYEAHTSHWDWAAGTLVAREAGAAVRTGLGPAGDAVVAAHPRLLDALLGMLDDAGWASGSGPPTVTAGG